MKPVGAYAVAKAVGAPLSTVYVIIEDLVEKRLLQRRNDGTVWLGPRLYHYGLAYAQSLDFLNIATHEMQDLCREVEETIQICGRDGDHMVVMAMADGPGHFRVTSKVGSRVPLNWTASGRLLLGHLPTRSSTPSWPTSASSLTPACRFRPTASDSPAVRSTRNGSSFVPSSLSGKVHVWELAAEPKAQLPPKHLYTKQLPKGSSSNFVILNNYSILTPAAKEGAIDFRDVKDGDIQLRIVLGKFAIGRMKLSSDRKWLAMEQHPPTNNLGIGVPTGTFEVGVYESARMHKATIPSCSQLLDVASGGKVVAVVREKTDRAVGRRRREAPEVGPVQAHANRRGQLLARRQAAGRLRPQRARPLAVGGEHARADRPRAVRRVADLLAGRQVPRGRADAAGEHPGP